MSLGELFILAVGLSMDAFAVSVCKGLSVRRAGVKECCIAGLYFGGFQALMPAHRLFSGGAVPGIHNERGPLDCLPFAWHHRLQYDPGIAGKGGRDGGLSRQ